MVYLCREADSNVRFTHDYGMLKTGRDIHELNHLVEMSMT